MHEVIALWFCIITTGDIKEAGFSNFSLAIYCLLHTVTVLHNSVAPARNH